MRLVLIERFLIVFVSDLYAHLHSRFFWVWNLLLVGGVGFILLLMWPDGLIRGFERPLVGVGYGYALSSGLILINLHLIEGMFSFADRYSVREWKQYGHFSMSEIVMAKALSIVVLNLVLIMNTIPLGLLVVFVDGLSYTMLGTVIMRVLVIAVTTGWIQLSIGETVGRFAWLVSGIVAVILIGALIITQMTLWILVGISMVLLLDLILDFFGLVFR